MTHNLEVNVTVRVDNLSNEQYEKITSMVERCINSGFGLEDWEFLYILNPDINKRRRTFFPSTLDLPELTREKDSTVAITKINLIS